MLGSANPIRMSAKTLNFGVFVIGGIRRSPNFFDFFVDGDPLALYCERLLLLSFDYIVNHEISETRGTRMKNKLILLLVLCGSRAVAGNSRGARATNSTQGADRLWRGS